MAGTVTVVASSLGFVRASSVWKEQSIAYLPLDLYAVPSQPSTLQSNVASTSLTPASNLPKR